jgi:(E)-4-hydroxy-3-methylbut-2-enyl-diphosphate synthase
MLQRDHVYPLHLGVTEAGEGEDGRIKSALGVGALLEDGLGDTIRVSLTEAPEAEMPVGYYLRDHFYAGPTTLKSEQQPLDGLQAVPNPVDPYDFKRRNARKVFNTGGADNTPRVIGDLSHKQPLAEKDLMAIGHYFSLQLDKWNMTELGADFVYLGQQPAPFMLPNGLKAIYDAALWQQQDAQGRENAFPYFASLAAFEQAAEQSATLNFVRLQPDALAQPRLAALAEQPVVLILESEGEAQEPILRHMIHQLLHWGVDLPVLVRVNVQPEEQENGDRADHRFQLTAAATLSGLVVDGLIDGVWLTSPEPDRFPTELQNRTAFGILQAGRLRITRTEYISCPSCGRTLFDLEETTARIRARTDHLKGVKIGIMGCIVNGPGEMADADYGYVGSGPGKITLYRGKEVVRRNVPTEDAVDALIELIDEDGNWIERGGDN